MHSAALDGAPEGAASFDRGTFGGLIALVGVSIFLSMSETSLLSMSKSRIRNLKSDTRRSSRLIVRIMETPARLRVSLALLQTIVHAFLVVGAGLGAASLVLNASPGARALAYAAAFGAGVAVLVVVSALLPTVFAALARERFARVAAYPLSLFAPVLGPVYSLLASVVERILGTRVGRAEKDDTEIDEAFKTALSDGEAQGIIDQEERAMIQGILESNDAPLREILVPRPDIVALQENATLEEALAIYRERNFSRMPIYGADLDDVTGVLFMKDVIPKLAAGDLSAPVKSIARQPMWVPESMTINSFMKSAQRRRTHLAIVVDEYGGTEGVVTLENAIEKIVGNIRDEHDAEEAGYEKLPGGELMVKGGLPLSELNELMGVSLESSEHETVAGFLMDEADRVLALNDSIDRDGIRFIVEEMDGLRVSRLRVRKTTRERESATS